MDNKDEFDLRTTNMNPLRGLCIISHIFRVADTYLQKKFDIKQINPVGVSY